jgi:ATP-dependent DNA helicase RecQ
VRQTFEKLEGGSIEFVFLAPEQFNKDETRERVISAAPSLFVVDEAHCISEWGHDFRPDYLKIGGFIEAAGHPPILAMTATASTEVRNEIVERLGMRNPRIVLNGIDRPNIWLGVRTFDTEAAKAAALIEAVEQEPKPGIVYAATRKNAEQTGRALSERGVRVVYYHGGMRAREREQVQSQFMSGEAEVIAATNGFGMGVDKADVRFVFHADICDSLDSYYQEVGRAGRDGQPAKAILFYRPENINVHKFLKSGGRLEEEKVQQVAELIHAENRAARVDELRAKSALSERKLAKIVARLEETGAVETIPSGEVAPTENAASLIESAREAVREQNRRREYEMERLEKMRQYAESYSCRREYLLQYFGEDPPLRCGNCDVCVSAGSDLV